MSGASGVSILVSVDVAAGLLLPDITDVDDEPKNDKLMLVSMNTTAAPAVSLAKKVLAPRPPNTV